MKNIPMSKKNYILYIGIFLTFTLHDVQIKTGPGAGNIYDRC
jgi:hypothetical protein